MNNTNLIQATPETESMRDGEYEAPVESRGRRILRVSGAVLALLSGVAASAGVVMAKTLAGVIPNGDSPDSGKLMLIPGDGQVKQFGSGGQFPGGVAFGNDMLLVVNGGEENNLVGVNPETGAIEFSHNVLTQGVGADYPVFDSGSGVTAVPEHGFAEYGLTGTIHFYFPDGTEQHLEAGQALFMDAKFVNGNLYALCEDGIRKFSQTSPGQFEQVLFCEFNGQFATSFDYSPSMNALIAGDYATGIHCYDIATLQEIPGAAMSGLIGLNGTNFAVNPLNGSQIWGVNPGGGPNINIVDIPSKQVVKTISIAGAGGIQRVGFSPDGTEFSVAISAQQTNTSRIVIFRINPQTGQILNENNPEVYYTDAGMHPTSLDVANDEIQPPKDTDNDGITDENDGCPNDYNPEQTDKDSDGTQDACQETPLDGYTEVFEFDGGSHVHTDGNVLVSTELGQVSMGEDGKANVIHSGNEPIEVTVGAWINFDIEVLEGEVTVPTTNGPQSVKKGDGKVPFGGNPDGVLLALSGTDFVVQTYDFNPPVEPDPELNPEPNPEENPEPVEYVEFEPDTVDGGGDYEVIEDTGGDSGQDAHPDETGGDDTGPGQDAGQDAGQDSTAKDNGGKDTSGVDSQGVEIPGETGPGETGGEDTSEPNPDNGNGGKGGGCDCSVHENSQTTWGKIAALLGLSFAVSAMRRRTRKLQEDRE